jgi:cbb3-type cytochrome oxidase subunit 1
MHCAAAILKTATGKTEEESMDRFVRNFIIASIVYLALASLLGVCMLADEALLSLKFVHSHLMLLGWVSMMIYGVGYHVLPRFSGRPLRHPKMGELQFWAANAGLVGMLLFYVFGVYDPLPVYRTLSIFFGILEVFSIFLFFYNMLATLLPKTAH